MTASVTIDGEAVMRRVHRVIDDGRMYYERLLESDAGALLVRQHGRFTPSGLEIGGWGAAATPVVLATGAEPAIASLPGLETVPYLTSDELLQAHTLPTSLAIVGGGPIAVEFAQALVRLACAVTLVLRGDAPLRGEEPESRALLATVLAREGVRLVTGATDLTVERCAAGVRIRSSAGTVEAAQLLLATGRSPAVHELEPEAGGIELVDGGVAVSETLATTRAGVWAIGDAIGGEHRRFQFTHVATHEGPQIAENALNGSRHTPRYSAMPRVTFTDPEIASVGLTEQEARHAGHDVHVHIKQVREVGKARAMGIHDGFVKVVIDLPTKRLLGATIAASHSGDMLAELTMPLHEGGSLDSLLATTFAHPTISEAVKVAVRNACGEIAELTR